MDDQEKQIRDIFEEWLEDEDCNDWRDIIIIVSNYKNHPSISENARAGIDFLLGTINGEKCNRCNEWRAFNWMRNYANAYVNGDKLPLYTPNPFAKKCTSCLWASVMTNTTPE